MNISELMQMALKHAQAQMQKEQIKDFVEMNRNMVLAKTINRLLTPERAVIELQKSLDEVRQHYQDKDCEMNEDIDSLIEFAKSSAVELLTITREMGKYK